MSRVSQDTVVVTSDGRGKEQHREREERCGEQPFLTCVGCELSFR